MTNFSGSVEAVYRKQSYEKQPTIDGVQIIPLKRFGDACGSMLELFRMEQGQIPEFPDFTPKQMNYSTLDPGMIKAFHLHRKQTDIWFVPEHDRILLILRDVRAKSETEQVQQTLLLGDGSSQWVRIPPGVAHGCKNVGSETARILYLTDLHFDPDPKHCDEGRLPWDYFGSEIWDPPKD